MSNLQCYIKLEDTPTGLEWLQKAALLRVITTEVSLVLCHVEVDYCLCLSQDKTSHKEIEELMDTLSQVDSYS